MFTSRAEYRLLLREDNADLRLTATGRELGVVGEEQWRRFDTKREAIAVETQRLSQLWIRPEEALSSSRFDNFSKVVKSKFSIHGKVNCLELLRRPEVTYQHLWQLAKVAAGGITEPEIQQQIEIQMKYGGYIERQTLEIARLRRYEEAKLPTNFDYAQVSGLSNEVRQKLIQQRPATIGQASRIPGMTPAAVSLLLIYLKKALGR